MPFLDFTVIGDRLVDQKLERLPPGLLERLRPTMASLTARLRGLVEAQEPQKTGKLRAETRSTIEATADKIRGRVFISAEFAKAGALEYGAHRGTKVKAHDARLDHLWAREISPMTVFVAEHMRTPDIEAHRFLRDPLAAISGQALAEIEAVAEDEAR